TKQVRNEGGLWDESMKLYPLIGGVPTEYNLTWKFPSGAALSMAHLEHDKNRLDYQGAQIPLILFDELTHFTATQFWYLLSRNRSDSGVAGYVRATCNPDPDSWVAELIAWWIDPATGYPIAERSGVLRWFVRLNDVLHWGDSPEELVARFPEHPREDIQPKSLTFIPSKLSDNAILMAKDPGYRANLMALPLVERERLLGGNWKIKPAAGLLFKRIWCPVVAAIPAGSKRRRGYDLAGTPKTETNNPDWTAGVEIAQYPNGRFCVTDYWKMRETPGKVEDAIYVTATHDLARAVRSGGTYQVDVPQDPGQAGKWQVQQIIKRLAGFDVTSSPEGGDKGTRFRPFSAQCEAGNVDILEGDWNEEFFRDLEGFTGEDDGSKDDGPDATSRAFNGFLEQQPGWGHYLLAQRIAADDAAVAAIGAEANAEKPALAEGSLEWLEAMKRSAGA
ncbi:MAG: phage terminase large subunit, partial [Solimonas sp.]